MLEANQLPTTEIALSCRLPKSSLQLACMKSRHRISEVMTTCSIMHIRMYALSMGQVSTAHLLDVLVLLEGHNASRKSKESIVISALNSRSRVNLQHHEDSSDDANQA